jgi:hypothetical protein
MTPSPPELVWENEGGHLDRPVSGPVTHVASGPQPRPVPSPVATSSEPGAAPGDGRAAISAS